MIIAISGTPGSGKSTVAKAVAEKLKLKYYSAGGFMRDMAEKRGVSLMELTLQAETDESIDRDIDEQTKKLSGDNFVVDSRLAFHFIPKSIKIFLKVDVKVAAKRVFRDIQAKKRSTEQEFKTEEQVFDALSRRLQSEAARYKKYYGVDYLDESNYDFVLDTANLTIEQSIQKVLDFLSKHF